MAVQMKKEQMVSATELVRAFSKYLEETANQDVVILKHNRPVAVLMDFERFEKLQVRHEELLEFLDHLAIYQMVKEREHSSEEEIPIKKLAHDL